MEGQQGGRGHLAGFVCRLSPNTAHTRLHTNAQTLARQQEGVCVLGPVQQDACPAPVEGSEALSASEKARPCWNQEAQDRGKPHLSLQSLGPVCCCQNPIKREVSSGNPASFLQRHNKSAPRPEGLYRGLCKPAKPRGMRVAERAGCTSNGSSNPSLLHDLPAPWDPSPRQEPAHGARSWESCLGVPGTQVGVDGMLAAWVPVLLGTWGGAEEKEAVSPALAAHWA